MSWRRLRKLVPVLALCAAAPAGAQQRAGLFDTDAPIELRLRFDFKTVFADRDTNSTKLYPATLTYTDSGGTPVTLPIQLRTRGHWRGMAIHCEFAPIRLVFPKESRARTLFAGRHDMKLVTHCRNRDRAYEEYVRREYLVYRILNLLTDKSYRGRLVNATYVNAADTTKPLAKQAMLLEDDEGLAKRTHTRLLKQSRGARFDDVDATQMALVGLFQYMVGGTDWSLFALHNIRLFSDSTHAVYPVPYDFDWTGLVDTPYAKPDYRLPIKTVRERLYRGPCGPPELFAPVYAKFQAQRDAIYALYKGGTVPLDPGYARDAISYFDEFYRLLGDRRAAHREFEQGCGGRPST